MESLPQNPEFRNNPEIFTYECPQINTLNTVLLTSYKNFKCGYTHANALVLFFLEKEKKMYSKTCLKCPLKKKTKIGFQDLLSLNAGQKNCRMLQGEHSAILWTFIKLPSVIKTFVLSIFEWSLKISFRYVSPTVSGCQLSKPFASR